MYKVRVTTSGPFPNPPYFVRTITLPFVPTEGLRLSKMYAEPGLTMTIDDVIWNARDELFDVGADHHSAFKTPHLAAKGLDALYGPGWVRYDSPKDLPSR